MTTASQLYADDLATVEQLANDLSALRDRMARWTARLRHEPPQIGDAITYLQSAQTALADAMGSIEDVRDGG